jgi:hypothetical protein
MPRRLVTTCRAWRFNLWVCRRCQYATNGGFFNMSNGDCNGNVVVNGTSVCALGYQQANFGITDSDVVVGYISLADLKAKKFPFRTMLQGTPRADAASACSGGDRAPCTVRRRWLARPQW